MANTVDYLPFATSGEANVETQSDYKNSNHQENGFVNGLADPSQANKAWRQSSMISAALATFISNTLGVDVLDDGNLANLVTNLASTIVHIQNYSNGTVVTIAGILIIQIINVPLTSSNTSATSIDITYPVVFPNSWLGSAINADVAGTGSGYFLTVTNRTLGGCSVTPFYSIIGLSYGSTRLIVIGT